MSPKIKQRRSDQAYEALKQLIIRLELPPGAPIEENQLMEELGVGRTPLREALQRLSQEDLIKAIPRRGYFVASISINDPLHVFEVRKQLEAFSARLAAERATLTDLIDLDNFLKEAAQGMESQDFTWNLETDRRFHHLVAVASGNPLLQQELDRLFNLTIRILYMFDLRVTVVKEEIAVYRQVFEGIQMHNPDAAELAMRAHLGFTPLELRWADGVQYDSLVSSGVKRSLTDRDA